MKPGDIYAWDHDQAAPSASDLELTGPEVPAGRVVRVEFFSALDLTTANKTIRLGYQRGGTDRWIDMAGVGAAEYGRVLARPFYLVGGDRPRVRVVTPTQADVIAVTLRGPYLE